MDTNWLAIFGVYLVSSTVGFIWWMATVTEKLNSALETLKEMKANDGLYVKKDELAKELSWRDKKLDAAWVAIDKMNVV